MQNACARSIPRLFASILAALSGALSAAEPSCVQALKDQGASALLHFEVFRTACAPPDSRCGYHYLEFGGYTVLSLSCAFGLVQVWGADDLKELVWKEEGLQGRCATRQWRALQVMPGCYPRGRI